MQSHRVITSSLVSRSTRAGLETALKVSDTFGSGSGFHGETYTLRRTHKIKGARKTK